MITGVVSAKTETDRESSARGGGCSGGGTEKGNKDSGGRGGEREEGEGSGLFINLVANVIGDSRIASVISQ